ncbi:MAG: SIMPL domain-containing protein [Ignavibacteria bacterium]|nr:SIMPL domain-containing protein [Ignavibacteria bacterium]
MDNKGIIPPVAISIAVIIVAVVFSHAWTDTHPASEKINVTGLAQRDFTGDFIVWRASFERRATSINDAYTMMKRDADIVRRYLMGRGVKSSELIFDAIDIQKEYRSVKVGDTYDKVFTGYRLWQAIRIESKHVDQIEALSREISELLNMGVELNSQSPEYYYTRLSELKVDLLAKAAADGRVRAEKIAENAGGSVGSIRRADMGIFQITAQNSSEDYSWGGAFNTSSKNKTASITVRMEFGMR